MPIKMRWDKLGRHLEQVRTVASNPVFSATVAVLGALAGFFAAVYADDIKSAFPFFTHWPPEWAGPIVVKAAISWAALGVFGILFSLNSWALTKNTDIQLTELKTNTERLENLIKTLPPDEFLSGFQTYLNRSYPIAAKGADSKASAAEIRDGILVVLSALAYTVKMFEGSLTKCEYSANLMLFRSFEGLSDAAILDFEKRAQFSEQDGAGGKAAWSGVLELIPNLAVFLEDDKALPDSTRLPRFVLEIPLPKYRIDGKKTAVLPGAPEAFCQGEYTLIPDTHSMGAECREKRALRPSVADAMDAYFQQGKGRDVRSFISIPIIPPGAKMEEPLGVVNIHNNAETMFKETAFKLFVPFTAPHTLLLSQLVENLLKLPSEAHI